MLPFCGYNMADYFSHWLSLGRRIPNVHAIRLEITSRTVNDPYGLKSGPGIEGARAL